MINETEYKIIKLGALKTNRIEAILKLKKCLNQFGYAYDHKLTKDLFDTILENGLTTEFSLKYKHCFDEIFKNTKYKIIENEKIIKIHSHISAD